MSQLKIAVISAHTSPLAPPGGYKAGGLNVYVMELSRELAESGCQIDIYSRTTDPETPEIMDLSPGLRAIHLHAGPARYLAPENVYRHLDRFAEAVLEFSAREQVS